MDPEMPQQKNYEREKEREEEEQRTSKVGRGCRPWGETGHVLTLVKGETKGRGDGGDTRRQATSLDWGAALPRLDFHSSLKQRREKGKECQKSMCGGFFLPPKPIMIHRDPSGPIKAFPSDVTSPCCATSPQGSCKGPQEAIALARAPPSSEVALTSTPRMVRSEPRPTEQIPRLGIPQPCGPGHCPGKTYRTASTATEQRVAPSEPATFLVFIVKSLRAASSCPRDGCNCRRPRALRSKIALTAKHSNGHTDV
ncbi:hypothetical protein Taro_046967 [Colocasia esculenta]|uniref:Uncharacterized protein n=1 Tax=Colocasia esculenta TaxID=4460 RepID=A0A843WV15_COLES|nr:hypothetical protein [Colocasia esculenta]